jgi:ribosomal protein L29
MKNFKDLTSMDLAGLRKELIEAEQKKVSLKFSKNSEAKKHRKQVARIKTAMTQLNNK